MHFLLTELDNRIPGSLGRKEQTNSVPTLKEHVFRMQCLLTEEALSGLINKEMDRSVEVHFSLQDVTLRHDPSSSWISKVSWLQTIVNYHIKCCNDVITCVNIFLC